MKKEINSVQKVTIEPRLDEREEEIDILETIRLSKLFPNAVDFALLSQLFPDVFLNSKKMIALKLDPTTECMELLEEKDVSGITETEIIPIEYHSSYTYGLSIKIKELLEEKPDFFKVFFQKYEKIVLDATAEEDDSALIIRDYGSEERLAFGYDLYYFIKCAFKSLNVDEEKIPYLSSFVFSDRLSKISYYNFRDAKSNDDLVYLLLLRKDWDNLYKFYLGEKSFEEIKVEYAPSAYLEGLNEFYDYYAKIYPFFKKHIDIIYLAVSNQIGREKTVPERIYESRVIDKLHEVKNTDYDVNDVIKLTKFILSKIDSTEQLSSAFETALGKQDIKMIQDNQTTFHSDAYCTRSLEGAKINIHMNNIIYDTITLVHEFIHYYTTNKCLIYSSEIASVYFGKKAADILIEIGYPEEEVNANFGYRRYNDNSNNNVSGLATDIKLLYRKEKDGELTAENIRTQEEMNQEKEVNAFWDGFFQELAMLAGKEKNVEELAKDTDESNIEYARKILESRLNPSSIRLTTNYIELVSYTMGTYVTQNSCDELDQIMLNFINPSVAITEDELFSSLTTCLINKKSKEKDSFQYTKKMINPLSIDANGN